ncbi:MAG: hypothetical protein KatS3mg077_1766 [Candidatus Binatia bacterium]|nr:MAG: hypothetical protein KatS3mg077_1766 [Candidatus Binatia bacterium]
METMRKNECPAEETLLEYALNFAHAATAAAVEAHLEICDACLWALALAQRRIVEMERGCDVAVPPQLAEKVAAPPHRVAATAAGSAWAASEPQRARRLTSSGFWPLALAAGAVLAIAVQVRDWTVLGGADRTTRSVPLEKVVRVAASSAPVRREPHPAAEVLATLRRGDEVTIGTEEREWYRVSLPNGTEGWVEQDAFR